jgi:hypothetical protein
MSDRTFQVHPANTDQASYSLEIYYKLNQYKSDGNPQDKVQILPLVRSNLTSLTVENFQNNTGLDVDLNDTDSVRNFTSGVQYIRARVRGFPFMSFDKDEALSCESWDLAINFDIIAGSGPLVSRDANANKIKCEPGWSDDIDLGGAESMEKPHQMVSKFSLTYRRSDSSIS